MFGPRQKWPLETQPSTVRLAGSTVTEASSLPIADCATSISSVAGEFFGKVKRPKPERWVAVSSVVMPESVVTL